MQHYNKKVGICLIQMNVTENKDVNNKRAIDLIRQCVQQHKPKLVVLPECFNTPHGKRVCFEKFAECIPTGDTCVALANIAKELKIYIIGGSIPECDEKVKDCLYNTMTVFGPNGQLLAKHRQLHVVDMDVCKEFTLKKRDYVKCGKTLTTFDMDGLKVGLGLCCDLFYCELATLYRKDGCDLICYGTALPDKLGDHCMEICGRVRAFENQMCVICCSPARNTKTDYCCHGHSFICDGYGHCICRAGEHEEIVYRECDFNEILKCRTMIPLKDCKRTDCYDTVCKC